MTAPAEGIVGDIEIRQGDRVTPSTLITTIDAPEGLEAYINVPLERATDLRRGLTVELLDTDGNVIAANPITFIAPRADDATQSMLVKATLRQMPPTIRVMQYVRARIVWSNEPALAMPVVAVNRISGQYFVFVAEQGEKRFVARQKPVTVGDVIGEDYIVRARPQSRRTRHRVERPETRRRRAGQAVERRPEASGQSPMFVDTFIRRPILATRLLARHRARGRAGDSARCRSRSIRRWRRRRSA